MKCTNVIVVEDDLDIREAMEDVLRDADYQVYGVRNGREASILLKSAPGRSLILLDMMMPVMNGWDFLAAHSEALQMANVPVVVVSALGANAVLADKNKTLPAVGYIKKPFTVESLLEIVEQYCEKMTGSRLIARVA